MLVNELCEYQNARYNDKKNYYLSSVWSVVTLNECFKHCNMTACFVLPILVIVVAVTALHLCLDVLPDFIK